MNELSLNMSPCFLLHRKLFIALTLILLLMSAGPRGLALAVTSDSSENESVKTDLNQWIQAVTTGDKGARSALTEFFEREILQWRDSTTREQRFCFPRVECVPFPYEPNLRAWAETGDPDGQFYMGRVVEASSLSSLSPKENQWYQKAAEGGHAKSQYLIGSHAVITVGEIHWLRASAKQGFPPAQRDLGSYYYSGMPGVLQSFEQAAVWWGKAAAGGDPYALWSLGLLYAAGEGVPEDKMRALDLFREAAWKSKDLKYLLGRLFEKGIATGLVQRGVQGFSPDLLQAHAWYNLTNSEGVVTSWTDGLWVEGGDEEGGLARVTKKLTPAQLAEAQRLAREWLIQHQE